MIYVSAIISTSAIRSAIQSACVCAFAFFAHDREQRAPGPFRIWSRAVFAWKVHKFYLKRIYSWGIYTHANLTLRLGAVQFVCELNIRILHFGELMSRMTNAPYAHQHCKTKKMLLNVINLGICLSCFQFIDWSGWGRTETLQSWLVFCNLFSCDFTTI